MLVLDTLVWTAKSEVTQPVVDGAEPPETVLLLHCFFVLPGLSFFFLLFAFETLYVAVEQFFWGKERQHGVSALC